MNVFFSEARPVHLI